MSMPVSAREIPLTEVTLFKGLGLGVAFAVDSRICLRIARGSKVVL